MPASRPLSVEELFRLHAPALRRHARALLNGSAADADDVLQDVALRIVTRHGDAPLPYDRPDAWLHACVRNACFSHLRARRASATLEDAGALLPAASEPAEALARKEETRALLTDLSRLEERQRTALLATTLSDVSHARLAARLGGTESAVTALVSRARTNLKAFRAARETPCADIRGAIDHATARGARSPEHVRRHLATCRGCESYARTRRRGGRRLAALLAPLQGIAGVLGQVLQRVPESAVPIGLDRGVARGLAAMALTVVPAGASHGEGPAPHAHRATVAAVTQRAPSGDRGASAAWARDAPVAGARPRSSQGAGAREPRARTPVVLNMYGCPKVEGRMTLADRRCRASHAEAMNDARLARAAAVDRREPPADAPPAPGEDAAPGPSTAPPGGAPEPAPADGPPAPSSDAGTPAAGSEPPAGAPLGEPTTTTPEAPPAVDASTPVPAPTTTSAGPAEAS